MPKNKFAVIIFLSLLLIWGTTKIYKIVVGSLEAQRISRIEKHEAQTRNATIEAHKVKADEANRRIAELRTLQDQLKSISASDDPDKIEKSKVLREKMINLVKDTTKYLQEKN